MLYRRMRLKFPPAPKAIYFEQNTTPAEWGSWHWQLRRSLKSRADFERVFNLADEESAAFSGSGELQAFQIRTTPYYASLASMAEPLDPIRLIFMPRKEELSFGVQDQLDPLGEKKNNPAPRLIHRYPDRVLFLVTDFCSVYCRYCTRKHFTGGEQSFAREDDYVKALQYISAHPEIREVILSGGDPLTLSDDVLAKVLTDIRRIDHVEIIRIGSRMPVVNPMRITSELAALLRSVKPVYMMTHFNHPRELTAEAAEGLERLVDHGVPVFNQMVLLNGVNNDPRIVQALSRRLLYLRVKPYYMFQCDPSQGTDHLRTSIDESLEIQRALWGTLSGLAMPTYSVDIPDGGGKTTLAPDFELRDQRKGTVESGITRVYRGWDGVQAEYKSPPLERRRTPLDAEVYADEWATLLRR